MQTSYPNLVDLLDQKTGKDLDKLTVRDPNAAHALALLDRDIPAFNREKGFSTRCERAFKQLDLYPQVSIQKLSANASLQQQGGESGDPLSSRRTDEILYREKP